MTAETLSKLEEREAVDVLTEWLGRYLSDDQAQWLIERARDNTIGLTQMITYFPYVERMRACVRQADRARFDRELFDMMAKMAMDGRAISPAWETAMRGWEHSREGVRRRSKPTEQQRKAKALAKSLMEGELRGAFADTIYKRVAEEMAWSKNTAVKYTRAVVEPHKVKPSSR